MQVNKHWSLILHHGLFIDITVCVYIHCVSIIQLQYIIGLPNHCVITVQCINCYDMMSGYVHISLCSETSLNY